MKTLMKEALREGLEGEITDFLGAAPGERSDSRNDYRAGYCGRGLAAHIGKLELRVPRDRAGEFSTALFERYARSKKAREAGVIQSRAMPVAIGIDREGRKASCGVAFARKPHSFLLPRGRPG